MVGGTCYNLKMLKIGKKKKKRGYHKLTLQRSFIYSMKATGSHEGVLKRERTSPRVRKCFTGQLSGIV